MSVHGTMSTGTANASAAMWRRVGRAKREAALETVCVTGLIGGAFVVWDARIAIPAQHIALWAGDLFHFFLPSYSFEAERLRALALPFWNPYQAAGVPFLATLNPGALYPARLLLLLIDVPTAMAWSAVGHIVFAALGTFALCRALGATRAGSVAGAVTFATTFAVPSLYIPSFLEAGAWLPFAGLALVRVASAGGLWWTAVLGMAAGMPVVAGGYQTSLYAGYGLALLALALLAGPHRHAAVPFRVRVGRLLLAALLAFGLAAPQLLPTLAWSAETTRQARGLTDLQILPVPGLFTAHAILASTIVPGPWYLTPFYLSVPVLVLALIGFTASGVFGAIVGLVAVAAYLLSFGPAGPWFAVYLLLPGFGMFRFPSRLMMLVDFQVAIGAALGLTALGRVGLPGRASRLAVEAVALGLVIGFLLAPLRNDSQLPWTVPPSALHEPREVFSALARLAGEERAAVPGESGLGPYRATLHRIRVLQDQEPLTSRRLEAYLRAVAGLPEARDEPAWPFTGALPMARSIARSDLLDLLSVRGLVLPEHERPPDRAPPWERVATVQGRALYRNPAALPRAYTVTHARYVDEEQRALATLLGADFDGREEAVLVGRADATEALSLATGPRTPPEPAHITRDLPENVTVDMVASRPRHPDRSRGGETTGTDLDSRRPAAARCPRCLIPRSRGCRLPAEAQIGKLPPGR